MLEYLQDFQVSSQSTEFWDVCGVAVCDSLPETVKNIIYSHYNFMRVLSSVPSAHYIYNMPIYFHSLNTCTFFKHTK